MKKIILPALLALAFTSASAAEKTAEAPHWSYQGHAGASHWGDLQSDFATCKLGTEQSPIDIRGAVNADLPALGFQYVPSKAEVVNNGHTIQVNLAAGSTVKLASGDYQLLQWHVHTPSEEKVNGKAYPLVAHLVHKNADGKLAVVAVLFKQGKSNPVLAKVFAAMPAKADQKAELAEDFNPADLLPAKQGYYAFKGSLTTPPCSEGVQWQVLKQPVEMSAAQLKTFRKLYPMNARPVQPLNGRTLQQSQ
ncbi:carbonic anhydrase family protein [Oxalobacteraceae bacterium]|nr:carbonic anhydrase family protein [Oxalobacteraceae bacterium]